MQFEFLLCILVMTVGAVALMATPRVGIFRSGILYGISTWCRWLPVIATLVYIGFIGLVVGGVSIPEPFQISEVFSTAELVVMFLAGPLFLSPAGNLVALGTLVYSGIAVAQSEPTQPLGPGLVTMAATLTLVTVLADRMPWHPRMHFGSSSQKIRDHVFFTICLTALGLTTVALLKVKAFAPWLASLFDHRVPVNSLFLILIVMLIGWLGAILGYTRQTLLPILCLPTYLAAAFLTRYPDFLLVIPFVAAIALSLASTDHQYNLQRRLRP